MSNRFESKSNRTFRISDSVYNFFSVALFVGIAALFFFAVDATGKSSISKQQNALENALARDIVQCYSIEGRYPPNLEYLEQHYGLTYDKETFFVDYIPVASNLYPDVTVILIRK